MAGAWRCRRSLRLEYGFEEGIIWHRNRLPTVTVRADIYDDSLPATLVAQIAPTLEPIRAELPDGYLLEVGGTVEDAAKGQEFGETPACRCSSWWC